MPERSSIVKSVFASLDNVGIASFVNAGVLIIDVSADSSVSWLRQSILETFTSESGDPS